MRGKGHGHRLLTILITSAVLFGGCGDNNEDNPVQNQAGVDSEISPVVDTLAAVQEDSDERRPVAAVRLGGATTSFVANEITINTDDSAAADDLAQRWNGEVIDEHAGYEDGETSFLLRVDPSDAAEDAFPSAMEELEPDTTIDARVSSQQGLDLLGVAARERASGLNIGLNVVGQSHTFNDRMTREAFRDDGVQRDAFKWDQLDDTDDPKVGVPQAWIALERAGIADPDNPQPQVGLAILDNGFTRTNDFPMDFDAISLTSKPIGTPSGPGCGDGNPCPWHGLHATSAAMAMPDDGFGGAGPAGHLAHGYFYETLNTTWTVKSAIKSTPAEVLNMSYGWAMGSAIIDFVAPYMNTLENAGANDKLLVASAGNGGDDLTNKGATYLPCEVDNVLCVGALSAGSTSKANYSNYESNPEHVDIYAMGSGVLVGPDPNRNRNNETFTFGGTSASAPIVAGIGAMTLAAAPSGTNPADIGDTLVNTAFDPGEPFVHKIVDADAAVNEYVNAPPLVDIQSPSDGASFDEGDDIDVSATIDDVDSPSSAYEIVWRANIDGVDTVLATSNPGNSVTLDTLCDGSYTIRAESQQKDGDPTDPEFEAVSTVDITVNDLPPTSAPEPCAPADAQVAIDQPFDGESFDSTETVSLEATINHDSPIFDIEWYLDDTSGTPVATGLTGTASPALGSHTVIVTYGSAQDSVGIDVIDTTNTRPVVTIDNPSEGDYYSSNDRDENGDFPVQLDGSAFDAEDGAITGSSLVWYKREEGSSDFTQVATGETATILLENLDTSAKDVTLRLVATDSEGRSAESQVTITLSRLGT